MKTPLLNAGDTLCGPGGSAYLCIKILDHDTAVLQSVRSGWRFVAHHIVVDGNGCIEWAFSTSGRFVR